MCKWLIAALCVASVGCGGEDSSESNQSGERVRVYVAGPNGTPVEAETTVNEAGEIVVRGAQGETGPQGPQGIPGTGADRIAYVDQNGTEVTGLFPGMSGDPVLFSQESFWTINPGTGEISAASVFVGDSPTQAIFIQSTCVGTPHVRWSVLNRAYKSDDTYLRQGEPVDSGTLCFQMKSGQCVSMGECSKSGVIADTVPVSKPVLSQYAFPISQAVVR
jgi:hypothetical protein